MTILALLSSLAWSSLASPPDPFSAATVSVRTYNDADGLPQNSVESMSLDPVGRMWVTTRDGGAVFDGTAWVTVPMPDPSFSNWPRVVLATSDGAVWFGIEPEGLGRLENDKWHTWDEETGLPGRVTTAVEHDGRLLVGTTKGIYSLRLRAPSPITELAEDDVAVMASREGRVYAATSLGEILIRRDGTWRDAGFDPIENTTPVSMLVTDRSVVVGTTTGLVTFDDDGSTASALAGESVAALAVTTLPDGTATLWAGTSGNGLFRFGNGEWTNTSPTIRIPNRFVHSLVPTPANGPAVHLFVGTLSGIGRIDLSGWRRFGSDEGLPESSVVSVMESRFVTPGKYYLGTTGGLVVFGETGKWEAPRCEALVGSSVFSMLESRNGDKLYFGTNDGLITIDQYGCRRVPGLDGMSIVSLAQTGTDSDTLWAGTYGDGVWSLDARSGWNAFPHDLPDPRIESLAVTGRENQTLWIATNRGLVRLSDNSTRIIDRDSGLPHDLVRSLLVRDGELWVGTATSVAWASLQELRFEAFDLRADGRMQNDTVYRLEEDRLGRIYAGTGRGVARINRDDESGELRLGRVYLADDGLPSNETNFGASMVDSSGRVWIGTPRGAGIFDPSIEVMADPADHRLIVTAIIEQDGSRVTDGRVLEPENDRIVAAFRLIDLVHGARAVYRTQLVGHDGEPGDWSPAGQRIFTRLRGGRYELRVWARDPHGHEAGPSTLTFSVQQPTWLSWWAVLAYVAVAVSLLYTVVGLRLRALRKRNRDLERVVRSRTRDLEVANRQLESANVTLADMSVTDPLTGAKNRRYLLQAMEIEAVRVRRSTRESDDIVFVLVDIDRFKNLNDRFGHTTGDLVLKQFHQVLVDAVRDSDTIVRWGGEEFLIVARKISRKEAEALVGRILDAVRNERFESTDGVRRLRLTCSIGFATFPFVTGDRSLFTWEQVIDIADHCLYAVKRSGRDGWVGLGAGPNLRSDSFLSRMRDDVARLATAKEVVVLSSVDDPTKLEWR